MNPKVTLLDSGRRLYTPKNFVDYLLHINKNLCVSASLREHKKLLLFTLPQPDGRYIKNTMPVGRRH